MTNDLFKKSKSALHWSPEECLNDALDGYKNKTKEPYEGKKCIVIAYNDIGDGCSWAFSQSGMNADEVIALLERVKLDMALKY